MEPLCTSVTPTAYARTNAIESDMCLDANAMRFKPTK